MKYCVFRLYSPLASWGDIAVGGERRSTRHPSKSAIIGIVAAALGIKRNEEEKQNALSENIGFGIKLINPGIILKDFHTAQVPDQDKKINYYTRRDEIKLNPLKLNTVLSRREYICDSLSIIAIWIKDELKSDISLSQIRAAMEKPFFQLYLGRKSCPPANPLQPQIINTSFLKSALDKAVFHPILSLSASTENQKKYFSKYEDFIFNCKQTAYYWEECSNSGFDTYLHKTERYDQPLSRKRWQFTRRDEFMVITNLEENE